jgi:hypothetical protein
MVDGSENAGLSSVGGMMKKGGAGPSSQQCILAFAISGDAELSTILHQITVWLSFDAVADPPRVAEGVLDREKCWETSTSIGRSCGLRRSMALFRKTVRRLDAGHDGQASHG